LLEVDRQDANFGQPLEGPGRVPGRASDRRVAGDPLEPRPHNAQANQPSDQNGDAFNFGSGRPTDRPAGPFHRGTLGRDFAGTFLGGHD
jgi:hypothetical protein